MSSSAAASAAEEPITVTLVFADTGQSESIPVQAATATVSELAEWAAALFGVDGAVSTVALLKDGAPLSSSSDHQLSLEQAGVTNGDLVAVVVAPRNNNTSCLMRSSASAAAQPQPLLPAASGGLDFSSLLGNNSSSNAAAPAAAAAPEPPNKEPVYYPGMNLEEAQHYNPHPVTMVKLLLSKEHLMKELNYYDPSLATKLRGLSTTVEQAADVWRQAMVKGGIEIAMRASNKFHEQSTMRQRLAADANDAEAVAFFAGADRRKRIDEQYRQVVEEYPESLGRVLMLYIEAKINGHVVQAFCDSGAQATIMSRKLATACGIADLIDERMAGVAVGVGTGVILGRIHMVQLQIGNYHFPCSVTVMDDAVGSGKEMPFLLGLDMMKRHTCLLDLERGCLRFRLSPGTFMDAPFLHEKDLSAEQGGTKGFDADKANQELMAMQEQEDALDEVKKNGGAGSKD